MLLDEGGGAGVVGVRDRRWGWGCGLLLCLVLVWMILLGILLRIVRLLLEGRRLAPVLLGEGGHRGGLVRARGMLLRLMLLQVGIPMMRRHHPAATLLLVCKGRRGDGDGHAGAHRLVHHRIICHTGS